jgi:transposase
MTRRHGCSRRCGWRGRRGKAAVIPPRRSRTEQRDYDRELYAARHPIENFSRQLKQFRAIATRYDKTARNFLAAVHLAATVILLS